MQGYTALVIFTFSAVARKLTTVCANLTHGLNPQHVSACSTAFMERFYNTEYSFLCTLVASPMNLIILFFLYMWVFFPCNEWFTSVTDTQCYNGYVLFVSVPARNVYNQKIFFFAYIYIYTVCMSVCMQNGCVQYHYQLNGFNFRVSDLLDIHPSVALHYCTKYVLFVLLL